MADERAHRRRRSRRRKAVVIAVTVVVVAAGAGTAWAVSGSSAPAYRLAGVTRTTIAQTVDADGTLTSQDTATQSFAAAGTVKSVLVKSGEHVTAGRPLATLDHGSLKAAVTAARNTLAEDRQTLADNEAGQSSSLASTSTSSTSASRGSTSGTAGSATTDAAGLGTGRDAVVLVSDRTTSGTALTRAEAAVRAAQQEVVEAQSTLDGDVSDLTSACTTSGAVETTEKVTADDSGSATGSVDDTAVVTIADGSTTSDNPQTVASGKSWSFAGLTADQTYSVVVVPVVNSTECTTAISNVSAATGSKGDTSADTLYGALHDLTAAVAGLQQAAGASASSDGGSGSGSGTSSGSGSGSGSGTTGQGTAGPGRSGSGKSASSAAGSGTASGGSARSRSGSGSSGATAGGTASASGSYGTGGTSGSTASSPSSASSNGGTSTTTISAARIAADQKAIDAAKAALAVARNNMGLATLTTPISGTVASVGITAGSSVTASSSSDTIVVTTDKALSVPVDISLADIDLIKVGESAAVTVDGRTQPLAAKVSMIGVSNASSSTGSSSQYQVTLVLGEREAKLYDGMGASVAIAVGTAANAISVPVSAVTTTGTVSTVGVDAGGKVTTTRVTLGVEGAATVQVTSGLKVGDEVVLADLDEPLPSTNSDSTGSSRLGGRSFYGGSTSGFAGRGGFTGGGAGSFSGAPP